MGQNTSCRRNCSSVYYCGRRYDAPVRAGGAGGPGGPGGGVTVGGGGAIVSTIGVIQYGPRPEDEITCKEIWDTYYELEEKFEKDIVHHRPAVIMTQRGNEMVPHATWIPTGPAPT